MAGVGVAALVQSSTTTAWMVAVAIQHEAVSAVSALAAMLGADVGSAFIAVLLLRDMSWLTPILLLTGVVMFVSKGSTAAGQMTQICLGLGLMLLAWRLALAATLALEGMPRIHTVMALMGDGLLLEIATGALLSILSFNGLSIVLLVATVAATGAIPLDVALGLVLGANLGVGLLSVLTMRRSEAKARRMSLGHLLIKAVGVAIVAPTLSIWIKVSGRWAIDPATLVVLFHLGVNLLTAMLFTGLTGRLARWIQHLTPDSKSLASDGSQRHLDYSVLNTPRLALSCAVREAMHQVDVVETMLTGMLRAIVLRDRALSTALRTMDDMVDSLHADIKGYLTQMPRVALSDSEGQRWVGIISFTVNMEQIGDIVEEILIDVEKRYFDTGCEFSVSAIAEIGGMHTRLLGNLHLCVSAFLQGNVDHAQLLAMEKARFGVLQRQCAALHLQRIASHTAGSVETSALYLDLISDLQRINSHICSITAYPMQDRPIAVAEREFNPQAISGRTVS